MAAHRKSDRRRDDLCAGGLRKGAGNELAAQRKLREIAQKAIERLRNLLRSLPKSFGITENEIGNPVGQSAALPIGIFCPPWGRPEEVQRKSRN